MQLKKILLLVVSIFVFLSYTNASHIVGGDITVKWVGPTQNDFQIQVRVFRSCSSSSAGMPASVSVQLHDLINYNVLNTYSISSPVINANLPFGDPCFTPQGLCVDEGVFTQNVSIPNNPNGYFLSYQICCRNTGITNITNSSSAGMTFYCEIPDPGNSATLNNSNPDMGPYPLDAYLCVNNPKMFQFNVTDIDGDSLVYSLVTPLDDGAMNATPAFPYTPVTYAGGYSLANMVGGAPPMTINQNTGVMTASPALIGTFVFGVLVEEFRNGVKIGETRRDAQYESQACSSGSPPSFADPSLTQNQTIQIPYNKLYCRDFVFEDINITDTLYMAMNSTVFDSGGYQATMVPDLNGDFTYYYDWNGISFNDSSIIDPNWIDTIGEFNEGAIGLRFCFTPPCTSIGVTYPFQLAGFSLGCEGSTGDTLDFFLEVTPPIIDFKNPGDKELPYGSEYCRNIVFHDTSVVDMLNITVSSEIFSLGAEIPSVANDFEYQNWVYLSGYPDSIFSTGVPNDAHNTVSLATRFCWTPDCDQIGSTFKVRAILSSDDCPTSIQDTIKFDYTVTPPFDSLDVVPNVITPNGDGMNDVFTFGYTNDQGEVVGGVSNPCTDGMNVQIYNRWGILVYESEGNPDFQWSGTNKSGKDVPNGTYFVLVYGIYGNETVTLDQRTVTVLR